MAYPTHQNKKIRLPHRAAFLKHAPLHPLAYFARLLNVLRQGISLEDNYSRALTVSRWKKVVKVRGITDISDFAVNQEVTAVVKIRSMMLFDK